MILSGEMHMEKAYILNHFGNYKSRKFFSQFDVFFSMHQKSFNVHSIEYNTGYLGSFTQYHEGE